MSNTSVKLIQPSSPNMFTERDFGKKPVLECIHLGIEFGGLHAVDDFNIAVGPTEIAGLIGPNGAGKTTIFNLLTKVYEPTAGTTLINGIDTKGMRTPQLCDLGVARTFQNIRLFNNMTVIENVKAAMSHSINYGFATGILRLPKYFNQEKQGNEKAYELLSILGLQDKATYKAGSLPYGEQRRLEIVRALATDPKIILLDEPAAGMNPAETAELMENIKKIRDLFGIAVFLIEHDMNLVMNVCEGICVLNFGKIIAKGTPEQIQNDPQVIEAYLGKGSKK